MLRLRLSTTVSSLISVLASSNRNFSRTHDSYKLQLMTSAARATPSRGLNAAIVLWGSPLVRCSSESQTAMPPTN
eukprot:2764070-Amphidinium_carterae.2